MKGAAKDRILDRLVSPLSKCLTPESAKRVLQLKPDAKLQTRVDDLARKNTEGVLSAEEREEYENYVTFNTFIGLLKSKIRLALREEHGSRPA